MNNALQHVAIVGGTHGNEWGGIYLYELWHDQPQVFESYPFEVECYLANPEATRANRRYMDQDLNRSFLKAHLKPEKNANYEAQRACTIAQELHDTDFLIDLHNTTSNLVCIKMLASRVPWAMGPISRVMLRRAKPGRWGFSPLLWGIW